jgi:putative FmdB family regulatory protein
MPTYEYECLACGNISELFQPITEKPKKKLHCERCEKTTPVRRLIGTGGAVLFKGSGFYQTDYRSDSYQKAAKAETDAAGGAAKPKDDAKKTPDAAPAKPKKEKKAPASDK